MKKVPRNYKAKVESDEGAFKLAGAVIRTLVTPAKFRNKCGYEELNGYLVKKFEYLTKEKGRRIRFLKTNPLVRHWCDISGYSYTRVKNKILEVNKLI